MIHISTCLELPGFTWYLSVLVLNSLGLPYIYQYFSWTHWVYEISNCTCLEIYVYLISISTCLGFTRYPCLQLPVLTISTSLGFTRYLCLELPWYTRYLTVLVLSSLGLPDDTYQHLSWTSWVYLISICTCLDLPGFTWYLSVLLSWTPWVYLISICTCLELPGFCH